MGARREGESGTELRLPIRLEWSRETRDNPGRVRQPNRPQPARIVVLHPIPVGTLQALSPWGPPSEPDDKENKLADDLLSLSVGAPLSSNEKEVPPSPVA